MTNNIYNQSSYAILIIYYQESTTPLELYKIKEKLSDLTFNRGLRLLDVFYYKKNNKEKNSIMNFINSHKKQNIVIVTNKDESDEFTLIIS